MERLQRILASRGVASRRAAEGLIREGRVSVNGMVVTELGTKADPVRDQIRVDRQLLPPQPLRYLILNKPTGYITTMSDERGRWTVMDLVNVAERVFPVGRLDRQTEGLLLFTNDGDVANRVMHPRYGLSKEYHVLTDARPSPAQFARIRDGIVIDGRRIVPEEVRLLRESMDGVILTITVYEGIYHLVRRIMDVAGIEVERLRRARIGPISIQGLRVGEWRDLTPGEQGTLFEALHLDDEALARQASRPLKIRNRGPQAPANPLWRRPKDRAEAEAAENFGDAGREVEDGETGRRSNDRRDRERPARSERGARAQRTTGRRSRGERPERSAGRRERSGPPPRDRNRRTSRSRQDDRGGPSGRPPRRGRS